MGIRIFLFFVGIRILGKPVDRLDCAITSIAGMDAIGRSIHPSVTIARVLTRS